MANAEFINNIIMKENVIEDKSFAFALSVVKLYQYLQSTKKELILSKQLWSSGTSVSAMVREAEQAVNKPDFIHKLVIAQKETNETEYQVELLYHPTHIHHRPLNQINN